MKTQLVGITPKMARDWLKHNTANRRLRPNVVENFLAAWRRGEWRVTHQGIAFSKDGIVKDGQHRLEFISRLPDDAVVEMNVTTGMENDTFGVIDKVAPRTSADDLGLDSRMVAVARLFERIHTTSNVGNTVHTLLPFVEWCLDVHQDVVSFCPTTVKIWSSAPVRAAAILHIKKGSDTDFVKLQYHALVHQKFDMMTPTATALMKQYLNGKIVSARTLDLFCRSYRVFDSRKTDTTRIQVNNQAALLLDVREYLDKQIFQKKKVAANVVQPRFGAQKRG